MSKETYRLFKVEIEAGFEDDITELRLVGSLSEVGRKLIDDDSNFRALVDKLSLVSAQALDEFYAVEGSESFHRGEGTKTSVMAEYLATVGSKEVASEEEVCESQMPSPRAVRTGTAGMGQEG